MNELEVAILKQNKKVEKDFLTEWESLLKKYNAHTYYEDVTVNPWNSEEKFCVEFNKVNGTIHNYSIHL
tara:strand:+ start:222 stop:428 length:207 start_codon:yes stop_codon:yes gene_type:complete